MRKSKLGRVLSLSAVTALGLMGIGANESQAAEFWIGKEGSFLLATIAGSVVGLVGKFLIPGRNLTINCQENVITSGEIEGKGTAKITGKSAKCTALNFSKEQEGKVEELPCTVIEPVGSSAKLLPGSNEKAKYLTAEPVEAGGVFTTKELAGPECSIKGTYPIKGTISAKFIKNGEALVELESSQAFSESVGDTLKFGAFASWVDAKASIELTGAHKGIKFGVV